MERWGLSVDPLDPRLIPLFTTTNFDPKYMLDILPRVCSYGFELCKTSRQVVLQDIML